MAKKEEIEITIRPDGTVSGDVICGPGGSGCMTNLDKLLGGLGRKTEAQKKPEFFQQANVGRAGIKRGR